MQSPSVAANTDTNFEMVKVENGAASPSANQPRLIQLAQQGDKYGLAKFVSEGPIDELFATDKLQRTALHWAADLDDLDLAFDCCKILIESIQDSAKRNDFINLVDTQERNPLIWSAAKGNARLMQYLIQYGCDPTVKDKSNKTPLHFVAELGRKLLLQVLHSSVTIVCYFFIFS